jgi:PAS domain S-box-containing protein
MNIGKKKISLKLPEIIHKIKVPVVAKIFKKSEPLTNDHYIRYRTLAESGRALIWTSGIDKKCNYFNKPWLDFTGRSLEQEIGDGWSEGVHPEDLKHCIQVYSQAFDNRESFSMNYRLRRHDNKYRWIQDDGKPLYNNNKDFIGYIGYCLDITELKLREVALRESEELYNIFINSTKDLVFLKDGHLRYVIVNKANAAFFNKSEAEIIGKTDIELMPEDAARNCQATDNLAISTDNIIINEEKVGDEVYESRKFKILFKNGTYGVGGFIRNTTKEKAAQEALRESEHLFNTLATISPVGIFHTNAEGNTTYVNPTWCKISGLSEEMAIGSGWLSSVHPDDRDKIVTKWVSAVENRSASNAEYRFLHPDGSIVYVIGHSAPEFDSENRLKGFVGTITDISVLKKMEESLLLEKERAEQNDRLKTAFLHNISHEIRTPMNAIIGFSALLGEPDITHDEKNSFIDTIQQSSNQLLFIISDIINISNIEAGIVKIKEQEINLNSKLKNLFDQFHSKVVGKNLALSYETALPDDKSTILTDGTKLHEILSNLIGNALKFTKQGYIKFGYEIEDKFIKFYVSDTGIGISTEFHTKIFDRFYQIENSISRQYEGTGIGLSICKSYVELLGGKIWLTSEKDNGSVFYFRIPFKQVNLKENLETIIDPIRLIARKKTILVAEDDDKNHSLINMMLSRYELNILHAYDGSEAVEMARQHPVIDLVLMDIKMPVMDGYEATRQIKKLRPDLPIIAQTAYALEGDIEKTIAAGCNEYLSKPLNKALLINCLNKFLKD